MWDGGGGYNGREDVMGINRCKVKGREVEERKMGRGRATDKKVTRMGWDGYGGGEGESVRNERPKPENWLSSGEKAQTTRVAIVATFPTVQCSAVLRCFPLPAPKAARQGGEW